MFSTRPKDTCQITPTGQAAECLQLLPLMAQTLDNTSCHIEAAVADVCDLFRKIATAVRQQRTCAEHDERTGRELLQDIDRAIVRLQFQDFVNQRLAHVTASLHEILAALSSGPAGAIGPGDPVAQWKGRDEALSLAATRMNLRDNGDHDGSPDVTLF